MLITQKHKYALRAILELAKRHPHGQTTIQDLLNNEKMAARRHRPPVSG